IAQRPLHSSPTRRSSDLVEARDLSAVYDVGVQRIGSDIAVLLRADGTPLPERDLSVVAAAHDSGGPALLLAAVHAVRELVIGARSEEHTSELQSPCNIVC